MSYAKHARGCPLARGGLPGSEQVINHAERVEQQLIYALGAGLELELGEVITEIFKPESKAIFTIHVRGTYADYDTIGTHREPPSRIAEKGTVRI